MTSSEMLKWGKGWTSHNKEMSVPCLSWNIVPAFKFRESNVSQIRAQGCTGRCSLSFWKMRTIFYQSFFPCKVKWATYLEYRTRDGVSLEKSSWRHVIFQAVGQVLQNGLHGVTGLLTRDSKEFLQWPRDVGEDWLSGLVRIHWVGRTCKVQSRKTLLRVFLALFRRQSTSKKSCFFLVTFIHTCISLGIISFHSNLKLCKKEVENERKNGKKIFLSRAEIEPWFWLAKRSTRLK